METPTQQPTPTTSTPQQVTPPTHRATAWWYVLIAVIIIAGAYAYITLRTPATSNTTTDTSMTTESTDATSDPVAQQLQAVSTANDSATIKQELSATDLTDVNTEMSTVATETSGL